MSYILDALRKADAQRERDPARGIHAQPGAPASAHASPRLVRGTWLALGAAAVAIAVAYAAWTARPATTRAIPSVPATGFVMEPPKAAPVITIADAVVPPAPPPLPAPVVQSVPAKPVAVLKAPPAVAAMAAASAAASPPAPVAAAAPERILAVAELPAEVQRDLPRLAISGGVHSENASQRMLIVGGQVKAEGAELAPGVVLEQIRPRTAVLRFKGFRYSLPY
jgi:general secretion pathway protein B